jgi:hypothetical protein
LVGPAVGFCDVAEGETEGKCYSMSVMPRNPPSAQAARRDRRMQQWDARDFCQPRVPASDRASRPRSPRVQIVLRSDRPRPQRATVQTVLRSKQYFGLIAPDGAIKKPLSELDRSLRLTSYFLFFFWVEGAYTQQGRAHIRRLHPDWSHPDWRGFFQRRAAQGSGPWCAHGGGLGPGWSGGQGSTYRALVAAPGARGCWWSLGVFAPSSCVVAAPGACVNSKAMYFWALWRPGAA